MNRRNHLTSTNKLGIDFGYELPAPSGYEPPPPPPPGEYEPPPYIPGEDIKIPTGDEPQIPDEPTTPVDEVSEAGLISEPVAKGITTMQTVLLISALTGAFILMQQQRGKRIRRR